MIIRQEDSWNPHSYCASKFLNVQKDAKINQAKNTRDKLKCNVANLRGVYGSAKYFFGKWVFVGFLLSSGKVGDDFLDEDSFMCRRRIQDNYQCDVHGLQRSRSEGFLDFFITYDVSTATVKTCPSGTLITWVVARLVSRSVLLMNSETLNVPRVMEGASGSCGYISG